MASSEFDTEPCFVGLSKLGTFNSDLLHSNLESSVIEQSLSDVAALISLGDTNISVPGRIRASWKHMKKLMLMIMFSTPLGRVTN